jgi:hypothetical protein
MLVKKVMINSQTTSENKTEIAEKPTSKIEFRIRRFFNIGILGLILLVIAYILLLGVFSVDEYWRLFPSEIPIEIWRQINFSLQSGYLAVILLQITGALLGSFAFGGYWHEFSSRVFLIPTIITIILTGILYCELAFEFFSAILTSGIYSATYFVFKINLAIGVILLFWGGTFWLLRHYLWTDIFTKATYKLLFFSGIFAIVLPFLFLFGGILFAISGDEFRLILQTTHSLIVIITLIPTATILNQSKKFLVADIYEKKPSKFIDIENIPQKLRRIRSIGLILIFLGFILCVPRFFSGAYFGYFYSITVIGFFVLTIGLTLTGIGFLGMVFLARSITSLISGSSSMGCGWLLLANEVNFSFAAISFHGKYGIPMYAFPGQHFVPYFSFFLVGFALVGITFVAWAVTLYILKKPPYRNYSTLGTSVLYFVGGFIVLCSIPFVIMMLTQSIPLLSEGFHYLSEYPPIIEVLSISWGLFFVLISSGIFLEILSTVGSQSEFQNSNSSS